MESLGLFCVLVLLVFVYIYKDKGEFKTLTTQVLLARQDYANAYKKTKDLETSVAALNSSMMKQKIEVEQVQEHIAWVREQQQILGRNQNRLRDKMRTRRLEVEFINEVSPATKASLKKIAKQMDGLSV